MPETVQVSELRRSHAELVFDGFLALWQTPKNSSWVRFFVWLAGLALICGTTVFIGAVPTRIFGHDIFIPLDIGWRVINGQRPHVDFTSAWGPVWFLVVALGLKISGNSVNGIGYASAIFACIVGTWSFLLSRERLLNGSRIFVSFFLAALVAAPYPLSLAPWVSSHAMVYNRYGYALLGLILLECCEEVRAPKHRRLAQAMGGFSTGAALSLALFLKASYFLVAIVLVAFISVLLRRLERARVAGILAGFFCVSLCFLAYLHFDLTAMFRDLRMVAAARSATFTAEAVLHGVFRGDSVLLTVIFLLFTMLLMARERAPQWSGLQLLLLGALVFSADVGLMSSNAQWGIFPLCAVLAILIVNNAVWDLQSLPRADGAVYRYAGLLCLGMLLFVPQFASDLAGLAYGTLAKTRSPVPGEVLRFTAPDLRPLLLYDGEEPKSNGKVFTSYVNDGVALLEQKSNQGETVLTIDMTNPFPYALQRKPPHGGMAAPTYRADIDDQHRPSDDEFLGDADIVMIPKHPSADNNYIKSYQPAIQRRYYLAAQSDWWWMCRRRTMGAR